MDRKGWIDYQRQLPKIDTHEHIPPQAMEILRRWYLDNPARVYGLTELQEGNVR